MSFDYKNFEFRDSYAPIRGFPPPRPAPLGAIEEAKFSINVGKMPPQISNFARFSLVPGAQHGCMALWEGEKGDGRKGNHRLLRCCREMRQPWDTGKT